MALGVRLVRRAASLIVTVIVLDRSLTLDLDLDPGVPPYGTSMLHDRINRRDAFKLFGASAALAGITGRAPVLADVVKGGGERGRPQRSLVLSAARLFDGRRMLTDTAVLIKDGAIAAV